MFGVLWIAAGAWGWVDVCVCMYVFTRIFVLQTLRFCGVAIFWLQCPNGSWFEQKGFKHSKNSTKNHRKAHTNTYNHAHSKYGTIKWMLCNNKQTAGRFLTAKLEYERFSDGLLHNVDPFLFFRLNCEHLKIAAFTIIFFSLFNGVHFYCNITNSNKLFHIKFTRRPSQRIATQVRYTYKYKTKRFGIENSTIEKGSDLWALDWTHKLRSEERQWKIYIILLLKVGCLLEFSSIRTFCLCLSFR